MHLPIRCFTSDSHRGLNAAVAGDSVHVCRLTARGTRFNLLAGCRCVKNAALAGINALISCPGSPKLPSPLSHTPESGLARRMRKSTAEETLNRRRLCGFGTEVREIAGVGRVQTCNLTSPRVWTYQIPDAKRRVRKARAMSVPVRTLSQFKQDADRYTQQLPQATSKDEALEAAIKAAEASMQALKVATDTKEKSQLSSRVRQLLTQAEKIKTSSDWKQAIQAPLPESNASSAPSSKIRILKEPQSRRKLPTSEQVLLLKAGYLNGFKFPPWLAPPEPSEFELREGEELFLYVFFDPVSFIHSINASYAETH